MTLALLLAAWLLAGVVVLAAFAWLDRRGTIVGEVLEPPPCCRRALEHLSEDHRR